MNVPFFELTDLEKSRKRRKETAPYPVVDLETR
jgi:hypothetical protein